MGKLLTWVCLLFFASTPLFASTSLSPNCTGIVTYGNPWGNDELRLNGPHVELRTHREGDIGPLTRLFNDPQVSKFSGFFRPAGWSEGEVADFAASAARHREEKVMVSLRITLPGEGGRFVGNCALRRMRWEKEDFDFDATSQTYDLGVAVLPEEWGHGYATEAIRVAVNYAFTALNAEAVRLYTFKENIRMKQILHRLEIPHIERTVFRKFPEWGEVDIFILKRKRWDKSQEIWAFK